MAEYQVYDTVLKAAPDGRVYVPVPFDPAKVWGGEPIHLGGWLNEGRVRGIVADIAGERGLPIGGMWLKELGFSAGDRVTAKLIAEGPLRAELAEDFAAALAAEPVAAAFWDRLAQFYRKAYVRWIDGTTRRPDLRALRIAEVVALLAAGQKARPK